MSMVVKNKIMYLKLANNLVLKIPFQGRAGMVCLLEGRIDKGIKI